MSKKTFFKRISLAVVSALAIGTLSTALPAQAGGLDDTLTLSASSQSVTIGDTATVTATVTFTSQLTGAALRGIDSAIVYVSGVAPGASINSLPTQDTVNAVTSQYNKAIIRTPQVLTAALGRSGVSTGAETVTATTAGTSYGVPVTDSIVAVTAGAYTKGVFDIYAPSVTRAGTYTWTISVRDIANTVIYKSATFTITVTAGDLTPVVANTKLWLHNTLYTNQSINANPGTPKSDSTLVVNAGTAGTPVEVGYIVPEFINASGKRKTQLLVL